MSAGSAPLLLLVLFCAGSAAVRLPADEDGKEEKKPQGILCPPEKPGKCPADVLYPKCDNPMVIYKNDCKVDQDCDGKKKCCFSGCKTHCLLPLSAKDGVCPYFNNTKCMLVRPIPSECDNDMRCQGTDRCCDFGCRKQCKAVVTAKNLVCPYFNHAECVRIKPKEPNCKNDEDCKATERCCDRCSLQCTPAVEGPRK